MDLPDVTAWLIVATIALAFAELQYRQEASSRWVILATMWVIVVGMTMWLYSR
jgi:hypothetical protein